MLSFLETPWSILNPIFPLKWTTSASTLDMKFKSKGLWTDILENTINIDTKSIALPMFLEVAPLKEILADLRREFPFLFTQFHQPD